MFTAFLNSYKSFVIIHDKQVFKSDAMDELMSQRSIIGDNEFLN